jgi:hypothetical protein
MATQTFKNIAQEMYVAYYGRPGDQAGLDFWADTFEASYPDLDAALTAFGDSAEYTDSVGDLSNGDLIEKLYLQLFDHYSDAAGKAFYLERLESGAATLASIAKQIADGAQGDDNTALANKVAVANSYTASNDSYDAADIPIASGIIAGVNETAASVAVAESDIANLFNGSEGSSANLTTDQDDLTGSAADDQFNAYIFDNSNTLQSGDMVDGGAGEDTLTADVGNSQAFAITPHTTSVEKLIVRAQADGLEAGDGDDADEGNENNLSNRNVEIDAQRMEGTDWYETNNSRADLLIEDVRIEDDQVTKDITVAMVSTDPGDIDFGVYFDQHSLRKEAAETVVDGAILALEVMDIGSSELTGNSLTDNPYGILTFFLDGVEIPLVLDPALIRDDADAVGGPFVATYTTLIQAVNDAIAGATGDFPELTGVSAAAGVDFSVVNSSSGLSYTGTTIVLSNTGPETFAEGTWVASEEVPADSNFHSSQDDTPPVSVTNDPLITSTIILDDVGRGSNGGDLVVGGLSTGLTSSSIGVEQFDITVERSSILGVINSTNNRLEEVFIVNGTVEGNLTVNGNNGPSNDLPGDETNGVQDNAFGFSDLLVLDASAMVGSVNLTAEISDNSLVKYLHPIESEVDAEGNEDNDDLTFNYDLGTNNDVLALTVGTGMVEDSDFMLVVDGNEGNDTITLSLVNATNNDAWYTSHEELENLYVNGNAGNDTIMTPTMGDVIIDAGAGDDAVYTDNTGDGEIGTDEVQTLTFSAAGDIDSQGQVSVTLSNGDVITTVGLITADTAATVATAVFTALGLAAPVGVTFTNPAGVVVLTYGATYAGDSDVASATVSGVATDLTHTGGVETTTGEDAVAEVITETFEVTTITMTAANATGSLNFDGGGAVALVDTDGNGSITIFEQAEQLAAIVTANADYTVTDTNFSLGQVEVTAVVAVTGDDLDATDLVVVGVGAGDFSDANDVAGFTAAVTTPANAEVDEVQTLTITKGADRAGIVTVTTDLATPYTISVSAGNARDAALEIAAALQATAEFATATVGAADSIITLTWAAGFGAEGNLVLVDGATTSATSVVETTKGRDGAAGNATTDILALDTAKAIWTGNNPTSTSDQVDQLDVVNTNTFAGIKGQLRIEFTPEMVNSAEAGGLTTAWVDIDYDVASMTTSALDIRQAIKEAIASDTELSKLLLAKDGPVDTFVIQSLIDGFMEAGDLTISFQATAVTTTEDTAADQADNGTNNASFAFAAANAAYVLALAEDDAGLDFSGAQATQTQSDDTVDAGAGTDVVVLSTSAFAEETVVFTGLFDRTTVVYFDDNADDLLDFTSYLNGSDAVDDGDTVADTAVTADATVTMEAANNISIVTATVFGTAGANAVRVATTEAVTGLYLVIDATDEHVASVYTAASAANATAVTTSLVGVMDLTDVEISGLTTADFAQFA